MDELITFNPGTKGKAISQLGIGVPVGTLLTPFVFYGSSEELDRLIGRMRVELSRARKVARSRNKGKLTEFRLVVDSVDDLGDGMFRVTMRKSPLGVASQMNALADELFSSEEEEADGD